MWSYVPQPILGLCGISSALFSEEADQEAALIGDYLAPGLRECPGLRWYSILQLTGGLWVVYGIATINMGLSENSVPLNPMVNDHYPY